MAVLKVEGFTGIAPRIDPKRLPEGGAQAAQNCVFDSGDVRPIKANVEAPWYGAAPAQVDRIHQWKDRWLAWAGDVDVVNSPVVGDQWERVYWTRGADLMPQFAVAGTMLASVDMTALGTDLGVIPPQTAPVIVVGTNAEPSVPVETLSKTTPVRVSTAIDHPFEDGQRVIVTLIKRDGAPEDVPTVPPDRTGMAEIQGATYVTRLVRGDSGATNLRLFDLIGANGAGWSTYDPSRWAATVKRIYTDQDMESRAYVFTLVTQRGEESQPSPPSDAVDVLIDSAVAVQVQVGAEHISQGYTVRLYRSVTGTSGTNFFFVREVPATNGLTIVDNVEAVRLGELLPSETWTPPPRGLCGLVAMPGGFLAGFIGNTLYFCEPHMPHAWPLQYRRSTQHEIVALGVYGQTLVVATRGKPYLAAGADPSSVSLQQLDDHAPCMSKACLTSTGTGVVYPTLDGLVHISSAGVRRLTQAYFGREQWAAAWTAPRGAVWHNGRYIASVSGQFLIFEPHDGGLHISRCTLQDGARALGVSRKDLASASGSSPQIPQDTLFFVGESVSFLFAFDSGAATAMHWSGKVVVLPRPVSFACGQVLASGYPVPLRIRDARIATNATEPPSLVYPASPGTYAIQVMGPEPFRMPGGFVSREWRVDIDGVHSVQAVLLATSMDELKQV